jgi:hypothetical protein
LRPFRHNLSGTRIAQPNFFAATGRISFSFNFAKSIRTALTYPGTNAFPFACEKHPHQFRSSANGRRDQPWDL